MIHLLADLLADRVASPLSLNALGEDLEVSHRGRCRLHSASLDDCRQTPSQKTLSQARTFSPWFPCGSQRRARAPSVSGIS